MAAVSAMTRIARSIIGYGLRELRGAVPDGADDEVRRKGAGRIPLTQTGPTLVRDLKNLVDPAAYGEHG